MKWIAPLSLLATLTIASPAAASERSFSVLDFDQIEVAGNFIVSVTANRATTARASGVANALDRVSLETRGRTLIIRSLKPASLGRERDSSTPVTIRITLPKLTSGRLQGNGSMSIGELRGAQAELVSTGNGTLSVANVAVDRLIVRQSGSGQVQLSGKALNADISAKGSGGIDASGLVINDLKMSASSSGLVRGQAARSANITSTGTGLIEIVGKAACTVQNTGPGDVRCGR